MRAAFEFRHDPGSMRDLRSVEVAKHFLMHRRYRRSRDAKKDHRRLRYLRLRREDYQRGDVESWANFVREQKSNWKDAFVYFKHEESGIGPK